MGVEKRGEAEIHDRFPGKLWYVKERMSSHCEHMKKVHCALSSTPRMWETKDGGRRSWTRTGTPSVRLQGRRAAEKAKALCP